MLKNREEKGKNKVLKEIIWKKKQIIMKRFEASFFFTLMKK